MKTQIWTAIAIYVLVAIVKKRLALNATLYQILQVLSVTLFEKTPILRAFDEQHSQEKSTAFSNQLNLLDFSPDTSGLPWWGWDALLLLLSAEL